MKENTKQLISEIVEKDNVYFTQRGNKSIQIALKIAKEKGFVKLLIQDQGGWITYEQFGKKLKFEIIKLKTSYGVLDVDSILPNCCVLINSLPGYAFTQDVKKIYDVCKKQKCFLINDATGSIGTESAKYGDIILGGFKKDKPISAKEGGFIALDVEESKIDDEELNFDEISEKIKNLQNRLKFLNETSNKIKSDLKECNVLNSGNEGINVIVKFGNGEEKKKIITYCEKNGYEYTLCPRYIRVLCDAVSIEVKRL